MSQVGHSLQKRDVPAVQHDKKTWNFPRRRLNGSPADLPVGLFVVESYF
jgi:hypothetical protein